MPSQRAKEGIWVQVYIFMINRDIFNRLMFIAKKGGLYKYQRVLNGRNCALSSNMLPCEQGMDKVLTYIWVIYS